ncbi:protein kinase domain-containing protein [Citrus sinensis]|uniref:Protein kinase domain-containing protein n=1 Tax=Citrus sinensis TaxID=2711 RepID=A0ACB8JEZ9_CITSI|nr:protein kinase domain-containing protein [Citrus sinensis]
MPGVTVTGDTNSTATSTGIGAGEFLPSGSGNLNGSESFPMQLTGHKLNGKNYLEWAQSIKLVVDGKGRLGYITGETKEPEKTDPTWKTWKSENSLVMSWLINSMEVSIGRMYLFLPTAKDVWDAVRETYSDLKNSLQIFELKTRLWQTRQGDRAVSEYYNEMKALWQELDLCHEDDWACMTDSVRYLKRIEDDRVYEFLAGLNKSLDEVRGRILGRIPLPSIREVFSEVRREEGRRKVMLGEKTTSAPEVSALMTGTNHHNSPYQARQNKKGENVWCDHCHKPRHTRETCWDLHGKPPNWKPRNFSQSNRDSKAFHSATEENGNTATTATTPSFSKEQLEQLYKLFQSTQVTNPVSSSCSLAQKGTYQSAVFNVSTIPLCPWIIDSGATDHMTGCSKLFSFYSPCAGNQKIKIADGSLSAIAGKGSIVISNTLVLHDVLHVPNLSCNLLSGGKGNEDSVFELDMNTNGEANIETEIFNPNTLNKEDMRITLVPEHKTDTTIIDETRFNDERLFGKTYTREKRIQSKKDAAILPQRHESDPIPDPKNIDSENPGTISKFIEYESLSIPQVHSDPLDLPIALRKGIRSCTQHPLSNFVSYKNLSSSYHTFVSQLSSVDIPKSIQEALKVPEWKKAVREEMEALEKNRTWEMVYLPEGKLIVGCKWIFTVKYNSYGSLERYKARLVAKGFTQTYGVDYQETFAPVAKLNTIRILLSVVVNLEWPLFQLDVKNAFLNGELEEEVYMGAPPGFEDKFGGKVYGGKMAVLIVYVDDIILTGSDDDEMSRLKKHLASEFEIKDLGPLRYFLGMEVARSRMGISVSQRKYVLDLLEETGMSGCRPSDTPVDPNQKLGEVSDGVPVDKGRYQRLVGKLIYLSHTRPDIAFAVSAVSQYMHSPYVEHLEAVHKILRYLKSTPGRGLLFKKSDQRSVEVFTDADWAGSISDRRSTSGYCTFLWGNLITWRSKKQNVVARSSTEAEFRAMANGVCEVLWIKRVLGELKLDIEAPMRLFCDNRSAISIANNPVQHDRTKHIEIDRHFIKEKLENGVICMPFIPSEQQTADVLTKGHFRPKFESFIDKLGMINIYAPT